MRLRNWLLMGTSLTLLALAPTVAARAQDVTNADVVAAYQAYATDQSDANKQKLTEACIAAGFQSFDDCVAQMATALSIPAPAPAAPAPAPAPASSEAPPPPPPPSEAPPPPPSEPAPAPAPSSEPAPAPAPSSEQAAPAPAPSSEQAAPAPAPAAPDISADLAKAVALYNKGAADIGAGNAKRGKQEVAKASGEIEALCQQGGFADVTSCLAQFSLTLDPIPEAPAPAAPSSDAPPPAPSSEAPVPAPAPSEAAPAPSSEQAAPAPSSEQAAPASSEEPAPAPKGAVKKLTAAVELYNQGVTDLQAGDQGGQAKIDKAKGDRQDLRRWRLRRHGLLPRAVRPRPEPAPGRPRRALVGAARCALERRAGTSVFVGDPDQRVAQRQRSGNAERRGGSALADRSRAGGADSRQRQGQPDSGGPRPAGAAERVVVGAAPCPH